MDDGGASFGQMRSVGGTDPEGRAALAVLQMLQDLEPWLRRDEAAVEPGSPLAQLDEQFTAAQSVSSLLRQSLAAATDNVLALRRLLFEEHGGQGTAEYRLQTHAPYSLVRTIIECTSTVLWALLPAEGTERARRSLVLVARDVFNAASFWDAYLADFRPERHARAMEYFNGLRGTVNEVAASLQLPPIFSKKAEQFLGLRHQEPDPDLHPEGSADRGPAAVVDVCLAVLQRALARAGMGGRGGSPLSGSVRANPAPGRPGPGAWSSCGGSAMCRWAWCRGPGTSSTRSDGSGRCCKRGSNQR